MQNEKDIIDDLGLNDDISEDIDSDDIEDIIDDLSGSSTENIRINPQDLQPTYLTTPPVPIEKAKTRIDKWVADCFPKISRVMVSRLINAGNLLENGTPTIYSSRRVKQGEVFTLVVPPPEPDEPTPQNIPLDVLYEDDDVIIVNKPAGMIVHPAAGNKDGTLVNALLYYAKGRLSGIGGVQRAGIVHRIDKDTSGILVIAKNDIAHRFLAKKFYHHDIDRIYKAIVWGVPKNLSGTITGNIGRCPTNRQKMAIVQEKGKEAITHYKTLKILANGAASLVECKLETGRTHQIRVHLTSIGNPLVGDSVYSFNKKFSKVPTSERVKQALFNFPRQALHAEVLGFIQPTTGEPLLFKKPMPADMQELYETLASDENNK